MSLFKRNRHLRRYICDYLDKIDIIQFYLINKSFRDTNLFSKDFLQVFLYLQETLNFSANSKGYINRYHKQPMTKIIVQYFDKFSKEDVYNALAYFYECHHDVYGHKDLLIDLEDIIDLEHSAEVYKRLDKNLFIYHIEDATESQLAANAVLPVLRLIKNLKIERAPEEMYKFSLKHGLDINFVENAENYIAEPNSNAYYKAYPNHTNGAKIEAFSQEENNFVSYNAESLRELIVRKLTAKDLETLSASCRHIEKLKINFTKEQGEDVYTALPLFKSLRNLKFEVPNDLEKFSEHLFFDNLEHISGISVTLANWDKVIAFLNAHNRIRGITNIYFSADLVTRISDFWDCLKLEHLHRVKFSVPSTTILQFDLNRLVHRFPRLNYFKINHYYKEDFLKSQYRFKKFYIKSLIRVHDYEIIEKSFPAVLAIMRNNLEVNDYKIHTDNITLLNALTTYLWHEKELDKLFKISVHFSSDDLTKGVFMTHTPLINSISLYNYFEHLIPFLYSSIIRDIYIPRIDEKTQEIIPFLEHKGLTDLCVANDQGMYLLKYIASHPEAFEHLKYLHIFYGRYPLESFNDDLIDGLLKLKKLCFLGVEVYYGDENYDEKRVERVRQIKGIDVGKVDF